MATRSPNKTDEYLRQTYLNTQDKCYALLETLRVGYKYLPDAIYENGVYRPLTNEELQARWVLLSDNVKTHTYLTYNRPAQHTHAGYDYNWYTRTEARRKTITTVSVDRNDRHNDRILILAEFIMYHPIERTDGTPIPIKYVMSSYGFKYRLLDLVRQYANKGVTISARYNDVTKRQIKDMPTLEACLDGTEDIELGVYNYMRRGECKRESTARRKIKEYLAVRTALKKDTFQSLEQFTDQMGDIIDETGFVIDSYHQLPPSRLD